MVGRAKRGVRGKGGRGPFANNPGGVHAPFAASINNSGLDTRQNNGQWKSPMLQEQFCGLHVR